MSRSLGLIFALTVGCSASRTVLPDGQGAAADVGADQVAHKDSHAADTAPARDATLTSDGNAGFPQVLDGVWLVGWMGISSSAWKGLWIMPIGSKITFMF